MKTILVATGILKDNDKLLAVKRSPNDEDYPGCWEFPGGHIEEDETIEEGLKRELKEEIGFEGNINPILTHYCEYTKEKDNELCRYVELDFIINVDSSKINVILNEEHTNYEWVTKDTKYFDRFIKTKLVNL